MFVDDAVLPCQFNEGRGHGNTLHQEIALFVLVRTIDEWRSAKPWVRQEADEWIMADDYEHVFSFCICSEALGINPMIFRKWLLKLRESGRLGELRIHHNVLDLPPDIDAIAKPEMRRFCENGHEMDRDNALIVRLKSNSEQWRIWCRTCKQAEWRRKRLETQERRHPNRQIPLLATRPSATAPA